MAAFGMCSRNQCNFYKRLNQTPSRWQINAVERGFSVFISIVFYHDAFIATDDTEAEWKAHELQTTIDYQIFNQSEQYLSFVVNSTDNWNAASAEYHYYNIDLQTNKLLTLQDILGDDYVATASKIIHQQIQTRMAEDKSITTQIFPQKTACPVIFRLPSKRFLIPKRS